MCQKFRGVQSAKSCQPKLGAHNTPCPGSRRTEARSGRSRLFRRRLPSESTPQGSSAQFIPITYQRLYVFVPALDGLCESALLQNAAMTLAHPFKWQVQGTGEKKQDTNSTLRCLAWPPCTCEVRDFQQGTCKSAENKTTGSPGYSVFGVPSKLHGVCPRFRQSSRPTNGSPLCHSCLCPAESK